MNGEQWDYLVISHAATELGIPTPTLRRYCDIGLIKSKRASDGSRLFSPEAVEVARETLRSRAKLSDKKKSA